MPGSLDRMRVLARPQKEPVEERDMISDPTMSLSMRLTQSVRVRDEIENATLKGKWIFYMFHGVGQGTHSLYIEAEEHRKLVEYLSSPKNRIWTAPAIDIMQYLKTDTRQTR